VLPITPGGLGITELGLIGILAAGAGHQATAQITAAILLYRAVTYLPPIPLGAIACLGWRYAPALIHARTDPAPRLGGLRRAGMAFGGSSGFPRVPEARGPGQAGCSSSAVSRSASQDLNRAGSLSRSSSVVAPSWMAMTARASPSGFAGPRAGGSGRSRGSVRPRARREVCCGGRGGRRRLRDCGRRRAGSLCSRGSSRGPP
jgi:hypothetical protein